MISILFILYTKKIEKRKEKSAPQISPIFLCVFLNRKITTKGLWCIKDMYMEIFFYPRAISIKFQFWLKLDPTISNRLKFYLIPTECPWQESYFIGKVLNFPLTIKLSLIIRLLLRSRKNRTQNNVARHLKSF